MRFAFFQVFQREFRGYLLRGFDVRLSLVRLRQRNNNLRLTVEPHKTVFAANRTSEKFECLGPQITAIPIAVNAVQESARTVQESWLVEQWFEGQYWLMVRVLAS